MMWAIFHRRRVGWWRIGVQTSRTIDRKRRTRRDRSLRPDPRRRSPRRKSAISVVENVNERSSRPETGLTGRILASPYRFRAEWIADGDKVVAPIPESAITQGDLVNRIESAARFIRVGHGMVVRLDAADDVDPHGVQVPLTDRHLIDSLPGQPVNALVVLADLSGAILLTDDGYSLVAGSAVFVDICVGRGIDEAKAGFARYARRTGRPGPLAVSREYPPLWTAWGAPSQVAPGTNTARQLELMRRYVAGDISGPEFRRAWLQARTNALIAGERVAGRFERILHDVFYALDEYVPDPEIRCPRDLDDHLLWGIVNDALLRLEELR